MQTALLEPVSSVSFARAVQTALSSPALSDQPVQIRKDVMSWLDNERTRRYRAFDSLLSVHDGDTVWSSRLETFV